MTSSETVVHTSNATGYLAQLCKHFVHKIKVTPYPNGASFRFRNGVAVVSVVGEGLSLLVKADTAEQRQEVEHILGSHLERFAFREGLAVIWSEQQNLN